MSNVVYTSRIHLVRERGPLRTATLPGEAQPVRFSAHGAIAEHYTVDPATLGESHAATIDYVIAATAG
jgi:hypothetical protein